MKNIDFKLERIELLCSQADAFRFKEIEIVKGFGLDNEEVAIKVKRSEFLILKFYSDQLAELLTK